MADQPIYGKGITVASGFDLSAKSPLDSRSIVNTIAERDAHITGNRAYNGMAVYVLENQKEYRYNGSEWVEILNDLSAVHAHDNKVILDSITQLNIDAWNAKSDFSGSYLDLSDLPTIPTKVSDLENDVPLASEAFVLNKIAEAELNEKEVDLSGYATKDDLLNYAEKIDLVNYVTYVELQSYQYADISYVDNAIQTHEHDTISATDIDNALQEL